MQLLETIIRDIAALLGVSTLVIEAGFLMLLTALILAFVLVLEAIIGIRKEMIKFSTKLIRAGQQLRFLKARYMKFVSGWQVRGFRNPLGWDMNFLINSLWAQMNSHKN